MSRAVFVDTSAWYALADTSDANHGDAELRLRALLTRSVSLVTTNYIVSETFTLLRVRLGAPAAMKFLRDVRASAGLERVYVSVQWEGEAENLLERYSDHSFSYVDATSFVAMQRLSVAYYLAYDHHFAVLGFLPAPSDWIP